MKLFKPLIIPLILVLGYLVLISYPYFFSKINRFNSLGISSLVEEKSEDIKKIGNDNNLLLAGEKFTGEIKSSENNLGVLLIRFLQSSTTDRVIFRIKEKGQIKWYYKNIYNANQFQPNQYFTFGFPVISDSQNKTYIFEVVSLAGTGKNGIGLSPKKPHVAYVYKPTKENLLSINLFSFILKKFIYAAHNANIWLYWPILISALLTYFMRTVKITKRKREQLETIKIKSLIKFSNKLTHQFATTRFYLVLLNTNMKKKLAIVLSIFLIAFLYRFSATLADQSDLFPFYPSLGNGVGVNSFYSLLGNGGDYDQFIRAATCALRFCPAILGQNFLFESSVLGIFYELFGFVGGLKAYLYLMIILSSIVATLPYLLLSRKNVLTIGGIVGSFFLATSDYLTHMSINLPPDNGSVFLFSIFFIVYLLTIHIGTIRWLLFFGLMGIIDGLNKLMLLPNDLVVLILFAPVFFLEKTKKIKRFPFIKLNLKLIFYSLLPFLVFLIIYSTWEYVIQIKFSTPYYLRGLMEGNIYASSTDAGSESINDSLSGSNILEISYYYAGSFIVMLKRLIEYANLNAAFLTPISFGLLFATFGKSPPKAGITKLLLLILFVAIITTCLELFRNNNLGMQDIGQYAYTWSNDIYINVLLFSTIVFLLILNFKYQAFKFALPIIPYSILLVILTKNAPWGRLWAHVIVWSIILLSFLIDWILSNTKKDHILKRFFLGPIFLVLFIFFYIIPKQANMVTQLAEGYNNRRSEVKYLKWVNSLLPVNAIILAGGKSDLVTVGENIQKPIVYSTLWTGALFIRPNEIPGVTASNWHIVNELQNKDNFEKNKYLILEDDIDLWRGILAGIGDNLFGTSSAALLSPADYSIKVYKFNSALNRGIYELNLKETGNL